MLESMSIKNIALIDEAVIEFGEGLNILTGETGAGKSMIIDSLNFALGEKTSKGIIRNGQKSARVEAVFTLTNEEAFANIAEKGVDIDDDGVLIITRTISESGKTTSKVNGQTVTGGMLKKISDELMDIHGQHEHQSLLNPAKHVEFLDGFCGDEISLKKKELAAFYKKFRELKRQIDSLTKKDNEDRLDYLEYRINELLEASLKDGEEDRLLEEKKAAKAADKLVCAVNLAVVALYDGEDGSAIDFVNEATSELENVSDYDKRLLELAERLTVVSAEIDDVSRELRHYQSNIDSNPKLLDEIEERLSQIYLVKRKYGGSVLKAIESLEEMQKEREMLLELAPKLESLNTQLSESGKAVRKVCVEITEIRVKNAAKMEEQITGALKDLGMEGAKVKINIEKTAISQNGQDKVEFFILSNKGEDFKPLSKIASGGEMSRIMLAIKSIAASASSIETFIFDEIDTGVSGRTAQKVAEKMALIAANIQILCITHLPQIAAMADRHILITKTIENEKTITSTIELNEEYITLELGRLLGGAKITEQTIKAAAEMRALANQLKNRSC